MKHISVGSENPTKLEAVDLVAFELWPASGYDIKGYKTGSGVSDQPMGDEEMLLGATNRAFNVKARRPQADYSIGMEGGIRVLSKGWFNTGCVCVVENITGKTGYGWAVAHEIPLRLR